MLGALALVCAGRTLAAILRSAGRTSPRARARPAAGREPRGARGVGALSFAAAAVAGDGSLVVVVGLAAGPSPDAVGVPAGPPATALPERDHRARREGVGDASSDREHAREQIARGRSRQRWASRASEVDRRRASRSSRATDRDRRSRSPRSFGIAAAALRADVRADVPQRHASSSCANGPLPPVPTPSAAAAAARRRTRPAPSHAHLHDVARQVGLRFRQGAFRYSRTAETTAAMMGGGLCWLDYDDDGWLDLFVVNSYADPGRRALEAGGRPAAQRALPQRARHVRRREPGLGRRPRASAATAASPPTSTCDGRTDLYVTTATDDALLWNNGDGTFTEGARAAGHRRLRLARRRGGGRRERRRAARPLRRRLHRPATRRSPSVVRGLPHEPPRACATSSSSTRAGTSTAVDLPRGRAARPGSTPASPRPRPRRRLHRPRPTTAAPTSTSPTTWTRTAST